MGVEEVVVWLVDNADQINGIIKLIGLVAGGIFAFRKWVMKPVMELIEKNEQAVTTLQKDYDNKREEVFNEVTALRDELKSIDQKSAERHERLRGEFKAMRKELGTAQDDIADVLGNELEAAYQKFTRQGWCPPAEKHHFVSMHQRYSERGHNHLVQHYEEDLLDLPDDPPAISGDCNG